MKKTHYKIRLQCRNCYHIFIGKIPFDIDVKTGDDAVWFTKDDVEHPFYCPSCGSDKINRK